MSTIIIGGGIIGLSTAYYLSLSRPASSTSGDIHIIDSSASLFTSASGYAGGFVALDWFSRPVASLGALSFRLHRELADRHGGDRRWGYAGSHVYSLSESDEEGVEGKGEIDPPGTDAPEGQGEDWIAEGTSRARVAPMASTSASTSTSTSNPDPAKTPPTVWTRRRGWTFETIGRPGDCAQVEPRELCEFLLQECKKRGVQVHLSATATGVLTDDEGALKSLKLRYTDVDAGQSHEQETQLECRNVVVSAGAWTPRVFSTLFPQSKLRIPIEPLAGHSIVVKSPRYRTPYVDLTERERGSDNQKSMCYAIYCGPGSRWSFAPEAFARLARGGETEVWVGGLNDSTLPLPELSTDVKGMIDQRSIQDLRRTTVELTGLARGGGQPNEDDLETIREGLCFRPISHRGTPLISAIDGKDLGLRGLRTGGSGVYIASGHGPWGISLSLGTGKVVSEMLMGQKPSADVRGLRVGQ
ncbi:FAD dependent oxidoreductase superfamily [Cladophialophora carrionii]|uniref:FAD dependent oxidoreductase superfamily n=1 Tax=Cladophialophora carrionii TaxID=86049 RepID=A0A1C1CRN3_9EURO|nr:FAD dependent oxidoreductase superfamily [Cladophialophora carrionii]